MTLRFGSRSTRATGALSPSGPPHAPEAPGRLGAAAADGSDSMADTRVPRPRGSEPTLPLIFGRHIRPGRGEEFVEFCAQVRARRDDFARSRQQAGVLREAVWRHRGPEHDLAVVLVDAAAPLSALATIRTSEDPFDEWFRDRTKALFEIESAPFSPPSSRLVKGHARDARAFSSVIDQYLVFANRLQPGWQDAVARWRPVRSRHEPEMRRLTGITREICYVQPVPGGEMFFTYLEGDVAKAMDVLATSEHPGVVAERRVVAEMYGIDATVASMPLPAPAYAWSTG